MHLQQLKHVKRDAAFLTEYLKGVPFVKLRYTHERNRVPFLQKMVYKKERDWTSLLSLTEAKCLMGNIEKWRVGVTFVKFQLDEQINLLKNNIFPNANILHFYLSRTSNYKPNMMQVPSVMPEIKSPPAREITPLHQLMYYSCIYLA